jgi:acyl transferase domain-containing protein/NADP-dependent 3-hydroxy acid dehydrogenase YdfG/acyl carrier protein
VPTGAKDVAKGPGPAADIAVVGMACRFGGVPGLEGFWRATLEARDCLVEVPADRWQHAAVHSGNPGHLDKTYATRGGFDGGVSRFGAKEFRVAARRAEVMDPQHRVVLEVVRAALQDAGWDRPGGEAGQGARRSRAPRRTGTFLGVSISEYRDILASRVAAQQMAGGELGAAPGPEAAHLFSQAVARVAQFSAFSVSGSLLNMAAANVALHWGFDGPAYTLDAACASSLVAVHDAVLHLRSGLCDAAVAGGVYLNLSPANLIGFSRMGILSRSGRCRPFDDAADGFLQGDGCGVVLLKRLEDAVAHGDRVHAVIRGVAVNSDGPSATGPMTPSLEGQLGVIRQALHDAGAEASSLGFVECHGTGGPASDKLEVTALRQALCGGGRRSPLWFSSVKGNFGHTMSAAGVAGLIRAVLAVRTGVVPPQAGLETVSRGLPVDDALRVATRPALPWPQGSHPRRAGVNSFGFGGTNCHVVVQEPPPAAARARGPTKPACEVVVVSAPTERLLAAHARAVATAVESGLARDDSLHDVAYTLSATRNVARVGVVLAVRDRQELVAGLRAVAGVCEQGEPVSGLGVGLALVPGPGGGPVSSRMVGEERLPSPLAQPFDGHAWYRERRGQVVTLPETPLEQDVFWAVRRDTPVEGAEAKAPEPTRQPGKEDARVGTAQRREDLLEMVLSEIAAVLGEAPAGSGGEGRRAISPTAPLKDLGLDSLMVVQLRDRLGWRVGRTLPATLGFDFPHASAIADHLVMELGGGAVTRVEATTERLLERTHEPIALVAMGCRFPGQVTSPDAFWRLLEEGVDAVTEVPPERWDVEAWYSDDPDRAGKMYSRWGGFLPALESFDPGFFGLSPREAPSIDPQQRLLLETAWEALERAGLRADQLMGSRTGVFMGLCSNEYQVRALQDARAIDPYSFLGTAHSTTVGRLSYWLGLRGPSLAIDTACSSSLVAVHLACQSLWSGECALALAGGANVMLDPQGTVYFSRVRAISPTGRCHTFSADADGYVRGEGAGVVVLERLSDARRLGHPVVATIRGSAVNQDGRTNGLTAPSGPAQQEVIREALRQAGVAPASVDYLECHGTGTPLGDPVEVQAAAAVLGEGRGPGAPLVLRSVKTNVGHTEAAAGVAGLMAAALALQHRTIPRSLHFKAPNPHVDWKALPVVVASRNLAWEKRGRPRRAGVSSFGFGGTNAHVVLEEAPDAAPADLSASPAVSSEILVLSAKSPGALDAQVQALDAHVTAHPDLSLPDLAFSLATSRSSFEHRAALVTTSRDDVMSALGERHDEKATRRVVRGLAGEGGGKTAFLFTGQGSQRLGMGRGLYAAWPVFRLTLDRCADVLARELDRPLLEVMWAEPGSDAAGLLGQTRYTQPALFSLGYALFRLWVSLGVRPSLVAGHSLGEFTAACAAGVFSLEEGLRLVAARGRLMQALPVAGTMLSVAASEAEVSSALAAESSSACVATVNGPRQVVISGTEEALAVMAAAFTARGVGTRKLAVSHAFHSWLLRPMVEPFREVAAQVRYHPPTVPVASNLLGRLAGEEVACADYWVEHVEKPVRFSDGVVALHAAGARTLVELGPQPTLLPLAAACLPSSGLTLLPSLRSGHDENTTLLESVATLYVQGADLDGRGVAPRGKAVPLWTYPWQRQRHWIERSVTTTVSPGILDAARSAHPLLGTPLSLSAPAAPRVWESDLGVEEARWLADHKVQGATVVPGAAYLEWGLAAASERFGGGALHLAQVTFDQPLVLPEEGRVRLQVVLHEDLLGSAAFHVASHGEGGPGGWTVHARGEVRQGDAERAPGRVQLLETQGRLTAVDDVGALYAALPADEIHYGPAFQGISRLWVGDGEALGQLRLPVPAGPATGFLVHPVLLDAGLQVGGIALRGREAEVWLPVGVGGLEVWGKIVGDTWCHARVRAVEDPSCVLRVVDLLFADEAGTVVARVDGLSVRRQARPVVATEATWCIGVEWTPADRPAPSPGKETLRWLVVGDGAGWGASLQEALRRHAPEVESLSSGTGLGQRLRGGAGGKTGIVFLGALAGPGVAGSDSLAVVESACADLLVTVQEVLATGRTDGVRLWVVTRGAQAAGDAPVQAAPSMLLGLSRVTRTEHPELRCTNVDLDPASAPTDTEGLLAELLADDVEEEVALRPTGRQVARLVRQPPTPAPAEVRVPRGDHAFRLESDQPGVLDRLVLRAVTRRPPGPGEVEVAVEAAGLNFLDVLQALAVLPDDERGPGTPLLGGEFSGRVVRVGEGLSGRKEGDPVVGLAQGTISTHLTTSATLVFPRPPGMSAAEGAAFTVAFLTAWYALDKVAHLAKGERVLIHSGTGGVGMAAVQWAQHVGAEVLATAGTPRKRALLTSQGVRHVGDSRSRSFVDDVMKWTHGEGVDVVLNSLSGALLEASLGVLRSHGRFVELGKRDYYANNRLGLRPFLRNLSFSLVDLRAMTLERPRQVRALLDELMAIHGQGKLRPLPHRVFPVSQAEQAFRTMAKAEHMGKLVLRLPDPAAEVLVPRKGGATVRPDATYVVTGGLGGLGLVLADWLAQRGATHVVLLGRRGVTSEEQAAAVAGLRARNTQVTLAQADVANRGEVRRVLDQVAASGKPLRGVIHAAGVLHDALLANLTQAHLHDVLAPKVHGAWHLHELTRSMDLDFFVLVSSAAGLLGSPGQGNYAAANAFLDGLAHQRRQQGLPALSVDFGPFRGLGMMAGQAASAGRWAQHGLTATQGMAHLETLLGSTAVQSAVLPVGRGQWKEAFPGSETSSRSACLVAERTEGGGADAAATTWRTRLKEVDAATREKLVMEVLLRHISKVMRVGVEQLEPETSLTGLGMDSLMALELINRVETELGVGFPQSLLWRRPTPAAIAGHLVAALGGGTGPGTSAPPAALVAAGDRAVAPAAESWASGIQVAALRDHGVLPASHVTVLGTRFEGPLDVKALQRGLARLAAAHPILSSRFVDGPGGTRLQAVTDALEVPLHENGSAEEVRAHMGEALLHAVDYGRERAFGARILRLGDQDHALLLTLHHVTYDGVTLMRLLDEVTAHYLQEAEGAPPPGVPRLQGSYHAFVEAEGNYLSSPRAQEDLGYWRRQLEGSPLLLDLGHRPDPSRRESWPQRSVPCAFAAEVVEQMNGFAAARGTTLFVFILTSYLVTLRAALESDDVVLGSTVSLRDVGPFAETFGPVINYLALRARLPGSTTFAEALAQVNETVLGGMEHRQLPLVTLMDDLRPKDGRFRPHLGLNANFNFYDYDGLVRMAPDAPALRLRTQGFFNVGRLRLTNLAVQGLPSVRPYDLNFSLFRLGGRVAGDLRFNSLLVDEVWGAGMVRALHACVHAALQDPSCRLSSFEAPGRTSRARIP